MKKVNIVWGCCCWLTFAFFLWGVRQQTKWISQLDRTGYQLLQPTTSLRTSLFTVITYLGDPGLLLPLSVFIMFLYWWRGQYERGAEFAGLQIIGYLLVIIIKYSILRPRPAHRLIPANGFSFPSGHTFATTVFALTILSFLLNHLKKRGQRLVVECVAITWIILVMASRVYLRNHFTSDVFAGLCLGAGWWLLGPTAWRWLIAFLGHKHGNS